MCITILFCVFICLINKYAFATKKLFYFRNAYHGDTPYSVGLCGIGKWKHSFPNGFGMNHVCDCSVI